MKQILLMIAVVALVGCCVPNIDPDPADTKASRAHNSETSTRP